MSEKRPDYVSDAMQMLGKGYDSAAIIEAPQTRLVMENAPGFSEKESSAWVKLSTAFKPHIKALRGAPLAVWLYISLSINRQGVAFPSIKTIADDLGYSHQGVIDAIQTLEGLGYLHVRRGERRYNLYEPEFAANGKGNEPVNSVESTKLMSQVESPNESTFFPKESTPLDLNKSNKKNKRGDLMDGILHYAMESKKENQQVEILNQLEQGLRINIKRNENAHDIAKKIIKHGGQVSQWLDWYRSDQFRLSTMHYMNIDKVWAMWPQAFTEDTLSTEQETKPSSAPAGGYYA